MEWQIIVALVVAIPIIMLPMVLVWYFNIGGIIAAIKDAKARRATRKDRVKVTADIR